MTDEDAIRLAVLADHLDEVDYYALLEVSRDAPSFRTLVTPVYFTSDHDRPDVVPPNGLEMVSRAYAKIIDSVSVIPRAELVQAP